MYIYQRFDINMNIEHFHYLNSLVLKCDQLRNFSFHFNSICIQYHFLNDCVLKKLARQQVS